MVREVLEVPIVGTVPAIKPAAAMTRTGTIGLLGTEATIRQAYVDRLEARIRRRQAPAAPRRPRTGRAPPKPSCAACRSIRRSMPAPPQGLRDQPGGADIDTVVLACTHFALIEDELAAAFGPGVRFVDGAAGIARRIAWLTRGQAFVRAATRPRAVHPRRAGHRQPRPGARAARAGPDRDTVRGGRMRRRYKLLIALLLLIGVPYYWLLVDNRPGNAKPAVIDIAEARRLAAAIPGPPPETVRLQQVGWRRVPGTLFVAGGGPQAQPSVDLCAGTQRAVGHGSSSTAGWGRPRPSRWGSSAIRAGSRRRSTPRCAAPRLIVFTHEHIDHISGLLHLPDFATVVAQGADHPRAGPRRAKTGDLPWPAGARARDPAVRYTRMKAIAPGVVLIRTPGHTPGSQMIFARLADGQRIPVHRRYRDDGAQLAAVARAARGWSAICIVGEDRDAVFGWLKAIRAAKAGNPS